MPNERFRERGDDVPCRVRIESFKQSSPVRVPLSHFKSSDDTRDKLKRAGRAENDEGSWQTPYSTVSRPFAAPKAGKTAVKVINHCGDEVLKVFGVG